MIRAGFKKKKHTKSKTQHVGNEKWKGGVEEKVKTGQRT